jgi:hypothetical protein
MWRLLFTFTTLLCHYCVHHLRTHTVYIYYINCIQLLYLIFIYIYIYIYIFLHIIVKILYVYKLLHMYNNNYAGGQALWSKSILLISTTIMVLSICLVFTRNDINCPQRVVHNSTWYKTILLYLMKHGTLHDRMLMLPKATLCYLNCYKRS